MGRPPNHVRRTYGDFQYQAASWDKPRRVIAKVEWHPGELFPRVGFVVTNMPMEADWIIQFYNQRGTAEQHIKEGKQAINWTRLSCKGMAQNEYRQAYNAQAVVDAGGSQLIVGARVTNCASDRNELVADIAAIPAVLGRPATVLADNGYANGDEVAALAESDIEALVATGSSGRRRRYDFRPAKTEVPVKKPKAEWLKVMAAKLDSEEGRALYRLRQQTVEPVFGIIKAVLGFTGFSLRGLDKVAGEWDLVALAYNCKRLHKLKLEMAV